MQNSQIPENASSTDELDKEFESVALELAQKKVDEAQVKQPNQLLPQKALLDRYKNELQSEFTAHRTKQGRAASTLATALQDLASEQPELFTPNVVEGINRIAGLSDMLTRDKNGVTERLNSGDSLLEIANVDDEVIETLYQAAKRLYDKSLFDDAADLFGFLTGLHPSNYAFWLGLVNAEYQRRDFNGALQALNNVCAATPNDPACHLTASRCYVEVGQIDKAIEALDLCLAAIEESKEYIDWKVGLEHEKQHLQQMLHHRDTP